jgi:hypothetical protein
VFEHAKEHPSQWAAIRSIAEKIGCTCETLKLAILAGNTDGESVSQAAEDASPVGAKDVSARPAVPREAAFAADKVFSMVCGKGMKTLKRHISNAHGMKPRPVPKDVRPSLWDCPRRQGLLGCTKEDGERPELGGPTGEGEGCKGNEEERVS